MLLVVVLDKKYQIVKVIEGSLYDRIIKSNR